MLSTERILSGYTRLAFQPQKISLVVSLNASVT